MKRLLTVLFAALLAVTLVGCGNDNAAKVKDKADSPASVVATDDGDGSDDPSDEPSDEATDESEGSDDLANLGDLVEVGDWDVKVTKVVTNANSVIRSANQFNDKPKGQYVLVTFEATYTGDERSSDIGADLTWSFTTTDAQVNDGASAVTPADSDEWPTEARKGGTVRGQVVFDLPTALISGGTLTVEGYDDDFDTVYADFKII